MSGMMQGGGRILPSKSLGLAHKQGTRQLFEPQADNSLHPKHPMYILPPTALLKPEHEL